MKKTLMISVLALAAASVFAQEKPAAKAAEPAKPVKIEEADPVIMSADGMSVRKSEFEAAVKTLPAEYQQYATGPGKKQFAEDYLRMKVLASAGTKEGLDKTPAVQKQLELMRENLVATEEVHKLEKSINVSDADVLKYYDEHKNEYEQVKARHILIAPKGSPAAPKGEGVKELTDEQAKAKAEELRAKIVAGGDFAELAKTESADTGSAKQGGELGSFGHGQMVPEFEEAAFKAKVGEVTPVVKTQFGYHIIKVDEHTYTPLEQVKPAIEKQVKKDKLQESIDALKNAANPKLDEAYFAASAAPASPHPPAGREKN